METLKPKVGDTATRRWLYQRLPRPLRRVAPFVAIPVALYSLRHRIGSAWVFVGQWYIHRKLAQVQQESLFAAVQSSAAQTLDSVLQIASPQLSLDEIFRRLHDPQLDKAAKRALWEELRREALPRLLASMYTAVLLHLLCLLRQVLAARGQSAEAGQQQSRRRGRAGGEEGDMMSMLQELLTEMQGAVGLTPAAIELQCGHFLENGLPGLLARAAAALEPFTANLQLVTPTKPEEIVDILLRGRHAFEAAVDEDKRVWSHLVLGEEAPPSQIEGAEPAQATLEERQVRDVLEHSNFHELLRIYVDAVWQVLEEEISGSFREQDAAPQARATEPAKPFAKCIANLARVINHIFDENMCNIYFRETPPTVVDFFRQMHKAS